MSRYRMSVDIDWGIFLPAVVILFYPAERIFPASVRLRSYAQLNDPAVSHRRFWWRWQPALWGDAGRIALAMWLVHFAITPSPGVSHGQTSTVVGALLLLGLIPQMVTRRKADAMFAPIGYVVAVLFVLLPFAAALPVAVFGVVALMALRDFNALFLGGGLVGAVLGGLLGRAPVHACLVAAVFILPVVVAAMFRCKLVLPVCGRGEAVPPTPLR